MERKTIFEREKNAAMKTLTVGLGVVVYVGVLAFTAVHNISLMTLGIQSNMIYAAYLGVIALELSALAFPVGLHFWAFTPMHRGALIGFYALDFVVLFANTLIDYAHLTGGTLPVWGATYLTYFAPASPLLALLAWAVLLALDPASQKAMKLQAIQESINLRMLDRIEAAMESDAVSDAVQTEAILRAGAITRAVLAGDGTPVPQQLQAGSKVMASALEIAGNSDGKSAVRSDNGHNSANPTTPQRP